MLYITITMKNLIGRENSINIPQSVNSTTDLSCRLQSQPGLQAPRPCSVLKPL